MKDKKYNNMRVEQEGVQYLTRKRLAFLLPSSKQLILRSSSIKYNDCLLRSDISLKKSRGSTKHLLIRQGGLSEEAEIAQLCANSQIKSLQNTIQNIQDIRINENKFKVQKKYMCRLQCSDMILPLVEEQKQQRGNLKRLTSLCRVLSSKKENLSEKKRESFQTIIMSKITKLEHLVSDLISGQIIIPQPYKGQRRQSQKNYRKQQNSKISLNYRRQYKQTSKSLKQRIFQAKIDVSNQKNRDRILQMMPQRKSIVMKQKNNLKISSNYHPSCQQSNKCQIQDKRKYINPTMLHLNDQVVKKKIPSTV